ncbi:MAG: TonB-dependent receptor [Bacteroidota bacterium]
MQFTYGNLLRTCGLLLLLCSSFGATAQQISGVVSDEDSGEPLIGVNVIVKGTSSGTTTDLDGTYRLAASPDATLIFSYTGYTSQEIVVGNQTTINIVLGSDSETLNEVVVVGYGKKTKATLTGAVASIDQEQLTQVPVANSANLIAGRVPGVVTRQNSGLPGGENTQIRIRGFGAPLVLVDGVQMDFSRVDPNDIESITVLKDAAAAVYGARAGNGVILVTTKRGTDGPPSISYNGSFTLQSASRFYEQVSPGQFAELTREADLLDGSPVDITFTEQDVENYYAGAPGFEGGDWIGALIKNNAPMQQHSLSVSGGSDRIRYFTSFGFTDQESYFRSRDYDYGRYNARSNIDAQISDHLSFNLDLSYRYEITDRAAGGLDGIFVSLGTAQPTLPTELPDPSLGGAYSGFSERNPLTSSERDRIGFRDQDTETFRGKLGLKYEVPFIPGLSLRGEMNVLRVNQATKTFRKPVPILRYFPATDTYTREATQSAVSFVADNQFRQTQLYPLFALEYDKSFGDHSLNFLALTEQITRRFSSLGASRNNLLATSIPELFVGSTDEQFNGGNSGADIGRKSYVGRLSYAYQNKYLLEATMRADGNVLFAPANRWGYFPSLSAGWVLSEENFLAGSFFDFLKLRASYSKLGDDSAAGLSGFDYLTGFDLNGIYLFGDSEGAPRIRTRGLVNPLLTWEELTQYNLGVEATFLDGRLSLEAEFFYRLRDGIIAQNIEDVPSTFGAVLPVVNINSQENRGFEVSALYQQRFGQFKLDVAPNFSIARARWRDVLSQESFEDPDQIRLFELDGKFVNRSVAFVSDGIFMNQEEIDAHPLDQDNAGNSTLRPGDIRYVDLNGDGELNFRDQAEIGFNTGIPELSLGLDLGLEYKGFRLSALIQGASKFAVNINGLARAAFDNGTVPLTYQYEYRWQPDLNNPGVNINPNAQLPAPTKTPSSNNNRNSDFWIKDVTYLRLKNLNFSYSLPPSLLGNAGIKSAQVYVAGENLLLLTNLGIFEESFDPEFLPGAQAGIAGSYPVTRSWAFGLRISL